MTIAPLPPRAVVYKSDIDENAMQGLAVQVKAVQVRQQVLSPSRSPTDDILRGPGSLHRSLMAKLPPRTLSQTNEHEKVLFKVFADSSHLSDEARKAAIDDALSQRWQPDNDGSEEIAYLLPKMGESFEVKLAAQLFHDPAAFRAVDLAIVHLRKVLIELNPDASPETIENLFFHDSTEYANVGVGVMTLDDLRAQANLRMLVVAFLNATFRWGERFDLCQSVTRISRTPDWRTRFENAGLDVERISIARERLLASGDSDMSAPHIYFDPDPTAHGVLAEISAMRKGRQNRGEEGARHLRWTYSDYARNGMPVTEAEYAHLQRKSVAPVILKDSAGTTYEMHPMRWAPLPPGAHGPEFPLDWAAGLDQRKVRLDTPWGREVVGKRQHHVIAGPSPSTAIFLAMFKWLKVPGVSDAHFMRAMASWMRLPPGHSFLETFRGAQMLIPDRFRGPDKIQLFGDGPNSLGASPELFDAVKAQAKTNPAAAKVIAEARLAA